MEFEKRSASWEAGESEHITGYAVVFEQRTVLYKDPETGIEYGEIIDRHALDSADLSDVVLRYNHQGRVLARTRNGSLQLSIDDHGLKIEASMSGSDEARSLYQDVKSGLIDKMSFAFQVGTDEYDRETRTRRISKILMLQDVALVDFPAYSQTEVSARSMFAPWAAPDQLQYRQNQVRNVHAEILARIQSLIDGDSYRSEAEIRAMNGSLDGYQLTAAEQEEVYRHELTEIQKAAQAAEGSDDFNAAMELRGKLDQAEQQLLSFLEERAAVRKAVAEGTSGNVIRTIQEPGKEKTKMENEVRAFYDKVIEARAAGNSGTMTQMIPDTIMEQYVIESSQNAFLEDASVTSIAHEGILNLPIAALQTVEEHAENAALTENGYVPSTLAIDHKEYAFMTAYSDKGMRTSAANLERIVNETCMASMLKKMDGICQDAAAALDYVDNTNAVKVTTAPAFEDLVKAAGLLASDYIPGAKWYCNPAVYFGWLAGLVDGNKRPILDPTKKVRDQALLGFGIRLDSNVPADTIYFGEGKRLHLNYARNPELNSWPDYDHNKQKMSVRTVAGAAAEPGCMVKVYKSA